MEEIVQRSCGCFIIGKVEGRFGWGLERPGLVGGVPAHGREAETR